MINKAIIERWNDSEVLLLGGSAGSFKIIFGAVKLLKANTNKAIIIVIHRKKNFASELQKLFSENCDLELKEVSDKDIITKNFIYIAPSNYHTLIEKSGHFSLDVSDAVWYSKPSIDITFESAADVYNKHCTAILLSGANQDGAEGLLKLRDSGALTIAQDPQDAEMPEMPQAAINLKAAEYILTAAEILELIQM